MQILIRKLEDKISMEAIFVKTHFDYFEAKATCRIKDSSTIEGEHALQLS